MKNILKRIFIFVFCGILVLTPCIGAFTVTAYSASGEPLKKRATYYTDEKLANMKENTEKYHWAGEAVVSAKAKADNYLENYTLKELWELIPSQKVFRSYGVNQTYGCLNCGNAIDAWGNYPYIHNHTADPWKLTCPNCKMRFPTNDFEAYYESGLDSKGVFVPSKADKSLLKNTLYPERGEKWGVDDGTSYVHTNGEKYFFIAYYAHWAMWYTGIISDAVISFTNAYLYTGEQKYADAGIVMINRIGDLYPSFNIDDCPWSEGYRHSGRDHGKIIGSIQESELVRNFVFAYDAFFRGFPTIGKEALDLLKSKNTKIKTYKDVMINIEDGLLKPIYPTFKAGNIRGNNGMHQYTLAAAAVVLDDKELSALWLDHTFGSGGNVSATFVNDVDRDGWGNEASPSYNSSWLANFMGMADMLKGYVISGTNLSYDLYENVKFKKMFTSGVEIMVTPKFSPNIGDSGSTGSAGMVASTSYLTKAYYVYGDPVYAQMIDMLTNGNVDNIRLGIFDKDPESLPEKIKADVEKYGKYDIESKMLTGFGLAACMNVNGAAVTSVSDKGSYEISGRELSVVNGKIQQNFTRNEDGSVTFEPEKPGESISIGFDLNNSGAVYEFILYSLSGKNGGSFDVYIDGKLLQGDVDFSCKDGERMPVYFRRTAEYMTGYHVATFVSSEKKVGPMTVDGVRFIRTTGASSADFHNERTTMTMYFGRNTGHGHKDTLNLEIYAFDINMTPDMGYPEFCDGTPHQNFWVANTVSHNTVIVNETTMGNQIVSQPKAFDSSEFVSMVSVDASRVYNVTDKYMRTSALIKYDNEYSYAVDFFAVNGGSVHTYSFHPAESSGVVTEGLDFLKQADENGNYIGTLAGANVPWGTGSYSSGYQYLDKVRKDSDPDGKISFDWSITEARYTTAADIHLKLTMLNDLDDVVLANGTPPRNKAGNPKGIDYVLASRRSKNKLSSLFVSVIEPYIGDSFILSTDTVPVTTDKGEVYDDSVKAVKVTFRNGRTDYIVYSEEPATVYTIDKKFYFKGFFAVVSIRDDDIVTYTNDAVVSLEEKQTSYTGIVKDFTKELTTKNSITVKFDTAVDEEKLIGNYIYIDNDGIINASYKILGVERSGENYVLDIGDISPVRAYKVTSDLSKGMIYDVGVNRRFYIRLSESSGDIEALTENEGSYISDIVLSSNIKKDASAGDHVGGLFVVRKNIKSLYQLPKYEITLNNGAGDSAMFEIKDGGLYLSPSYEAGKGNYNVSFKITDIDSGETKTVTKLITTLSKSQSDSQRALGFTLSETKETAEFPVTELPPQLETENDTERSINWMLVAVTTVICMALVSVTAVMKRKA
ncbi:MAG: alginate lyase family protein [Ruminococcaceae bacterium]|nr:alginate lyase family protein [Oscillospiraceae bacterium]